MKIYINGKYNTPYQLKLPLEIEKIIEISDPVYTFSEVMENIDLRKYLAVKESKTGRKRYSPEILLKIIRDSQYRESRISSSCFFTAPFLRKSD